MLEVICDLLLSFIGFSLDTVGVAFADLFSSAFFSSSNNLKNINKDIKGSPIRNKVQHRRKLPSKQKRAEKKVIHKEK